MGGITLAANNLRVPDQQPNALEQYARIMQLQQQQKLMPGQLQMQQQQIQAGQQENQQRAQAIKDQQAMTTAYQKWDGKNPDDLAKLVSDNGGSANARTTIEQHYLGLKKQYSDIAKNDAETGQKNLDILKQKNDNVLGVLTAASSVPDDQLASHLATSVQSLTQQGMLDPEHAQTAAQLIQGMQSGQVQPAQARQALDIFKKGLQSNSQQLTQAKDEADAREKNAQAAKQEAENKFLQENGGMTPGMAESRYLSIQTKINQGQPVSAVDKSFAKAYEKNKALVPTANFNLQNAGATGQGGQPSAIAQAIANGSMKWNDAVSPRTPMQVKEAILREVKGINPNFNSGDFAVEQKVREKYTSGNVSDQLLAINTAREHMKTFGQLADALDNNNVQAANAIGNAFGVQFGSDKATNFKIAAQAFGGEVGKALDGAHVTAGEREQAASAFNANMSPAQFRGAVKTVDNLLAGKQKAAKDAFDTGTQGKPNFGNQSSQYTAPSGAPTATGKNGHKIVYDNGKWVDASTGNPIQ